MKGKGTGEARQPPINLRIIRAGCPTGMSTPRRTGPLQLLWETALGEGGMRDITRKPMPVDTDDWTTVVKPFVIRRKGGATGQTTGAASLGATTATAAEITPPIATVTVGASQVTATGVAGGDLAAGS